MQSRNIVACLVLGALSACAPLSSDHSEKTDAPIDYHPPTPMTGTLEARNRAITTALTSDDERIAQLNLQNRSLEIALHFLANHANADMRIDWPALERVGISRDNATSTINLF